MNLQRLSSSLDRIGSAGALVAAIAAPCCFPIFAAVAAGVGLGAFGHYETVILYAFQGFALLAFAGLLLGYRSHRRIGPVLLGLLSVAAIAYTFYLSFRFETLYVGLFGLLAGTLWNYFSSRTRRDQQPVLLSVITCPNCGHKNDETMPTNACVFFYDCIACHSRLKPKTGDCCVFCSYGSVPCPPIQTGESCCA